MSVLLRTLPRVRAARVTIVNKRFNATTVSTQQKKWERAEIQTIYDSPLMELIFRAASVHRVYQPVGEVQLCTLLNIKTGGCGEDCSYCAQSARYADKVGLKAEKLSEVEPVLV